MSRRGRRGRSKSNNTPLIATIIAAVAVVLLVFLMNNGGLNFGSDSSCGDREEDSENSGYCIPLSTDADELVIVTGNTQNSPAPNLDFTQGELNDILSGVFYNSRRGDFPSISIISAAGNNYAMNYNKKYKVAQNVIASNNELRKLGKELNNAIKELPTEPGVDYLGAIIEAKNLISSSSSKNPLILVIGSGYNDSGMLDFTSNDLIGGYRKSGSEYIVNLMKSNKNIKNGMLNGISVYWYNIGAVVSPQPNMNNFKDDTKEIYKEVLSYLGAKNVKLDFTTPLTADAKSVDSQFSVLPVFVDELKDGDTMSVNENIAQFEANRSNLINEADTKKKLAVFASKFNPKSETKLVLTGYTYVNNSSSAPCHTDGSLALSRARTIKNILVSLGVPSNKIDTIGERGAPPNDNNNGSYTCDSPLPASEQRTVIIRVVKE